MIPRLLLVALCAMAASAEPLDTILARMDVSAKNNPAFSADVQWDSYTKAIDDTDASSGVIKLKRDNDRVIGRLDIDKPDIFVLHFGRETAEKYLPKANVLEVYRIAKMPKVVMLAVGLVFGISGEEMGKSFDITATVEETVNGIKATRLELVPKDKKARDLVAKAELWIPIGQSYSVRQKLTAPNGNFNLWNYSNIKVNPQLPASAFDFVAPAGAKQQLFN